MCPPIFLQRTSVHNDHTQRFQQSGGHTRGVKWLTKTKEDWAQWFMLVITTTQEPETMKIVVPISINKPVMVVHSCGPSYMESLDRRQALGKKCKSLSKK
jgi:hypothetical protein